MRAHASRFWRQHDEGLRGLRAILPLWTERRFEELRIIQAPDGPVRVIYSYFVREGGEGVKFIKHARFELP